MAEKKKWIQKAIKKPGALRESLGVKKGEKIPAKKLEAAAKKGGETGRVFGEKGWMDGTEYRGGVKDLPNISRPPLPPGVNAGGHGGSHGQLMNEFVLSLLEDRKPLVDVAQALNMTVSGIIANQSALKDGERLKVPQYRI